jgi:flagellar biogenesis protein FliO
VSTGHDAPRGSGSGARPVPAAALPAAATTHRGTETTHLAAASHATHATQAGLAATHAGAAAAPVAQASLGGLLVQMVVALGVVLGLLWLLARLARSGRLGGRPGARVGPAALAGPWRAPRLGRAGLGRGAIRVEDRQLLGRGVALVVVSVASSRLLVSVTPQRVELLAELDGGGPRAARGGDAGPGLGAPGSSGGEEEEEAERSVDLRSLLEDPEASSGVPSWARPPGGSLVERLRELTVRRS